MIVFGIIRGDSGASGRAALHAFLAGRGDHRWLPRDHRAAQPSVAGGGAARGGGGAVRPVRAVAVRGVVQHHELGGRPAARAMAVASGAGARPAERDGGAAGLPAASGAGARVQPVLRRPAFPGADPVPDLGVLAASPGIPSGPDHPGAVHRFQPARAVDPGGAAAAAGRYRDGRYRVPLWGVGLYLGQRRAGSGSVFGDAFGACWLGDNRGHRRGHRFAASLAVGRGGLSRADDAGRGGDRESLLARRGGGGGTGRTGRGGAADRRGFAPVWLAWFGPVRGRTRMRS
jgi:hypothetical protein